MIDGGGVSAPTPTSLRQQGAGKSISEAELGPAESSWHVTICRAA